MANNSELAHCFEGLLKPVIISHKTNALEVPLLDLANELLEAIAENLRSETDINSFAQTNRRLYGLLNAYLYRHNIQQAGSSALFWAVKHGRETAAQRLLSEGANAQATTNYGWTPLSLAAGNGHEAVVKLLLAHDGVDPEFKDREWRTPLSLAAENGHEAVVKLLLANDGVDPDSKENEGRTPLWWAAFNGHDVVVELLLAKDGVDPDSEDDYGWRPLSWAAFNGHEAMVRLLLARDGVSPNSQDNSGQTPLSLAAENGHQGVIELLTHQKRETERPNAQISGLLKYFRIGAW